MLRIIIGACVLFCSCARISMKFNGDRLTPLTTENAVTLSGVYNSHCDSCHNAENGLWWYVSGKINKVHHNIVIDAGRPRKLIFKRPHANGDTTVSIIRGRYRNGYFESRARWNAKMALGPVLWVAGPSRLLIAQTHNRQLQVWYSSASLLLVGVMPISGSNGEMDGIFSRTGLQP